MKLKDYIKHLNNLIKDNPEALEFDTVYGKDDEGNSFYFVNYQPSIGKYTNLEFEENSSEPNAVCIN